EGERGHGGGGRGGEYGHGKRELSRGDFSALLRDMLGDVAVRLEEHPSPEQLQAVAEELFRDWDTHNHGKLSCRDVSAGLAGLGPSLGLPPPVAKDAEGFYRELFVAADMDDSGFLDHAELRGMLQSLFEKLASELEAKPLVLECTVIST
ncbi:unnamed protein product, partial [Closterium sp. Naga37s-1]